MEYLPTSAALIFFLSIVLTNMFTLTCLAWIVPGSSLRKLADKCMWEVAYAIAGEHKGLREFLVSIR